MRRSPFLNAAWLLAPAGAFPQSAQHDNVEVIETAPPRAPDEKKPDHDAVLSEPRTERSGVSGQRGAHEARLAQPREPPWPLTPLRSVRGSD
ncbi:MAG TPA: hypothetical protein VKD90_29105 [Gemmataceae bacterium]|nr:hypothetical protein [Gemmataceae bacterium]